MAATGYYFNIYLNILYCIELGVYENIAGSENKHILVYTQKRQYIQEQVYDLC